MPPQEYVPVSCIRDACAKINADGALVPVNDAMRSWLAEFGEKLDALPITQDDQARLRAGDEVLLQAADHVWELRRRDYDGGSWLIAADVTDREDRQSTLFNAMRCRALGALAASLSHDLNNQFNSVLALSSELGILAEDEEDRECLRDLERGTKIGATAVGALARMLVRAPARRERVELRTILEDALSIVRKAYQQRGVALEVDGRADLPAVRVVAADVLQGITAVLESLLEKEAARVELSTRVERRALGDGRPRDLVVLSLQVHGLSPGLIDSFVDIITCAPGALRALARDTGFSQSLMAAAFLQRRLGGELSAKASGDQLSVEFWWPSAG